MNRLSLQAAGGLKAVHHGHHDVEDKYVGLEAQRSFNGLLSVQYGADHLKLDIQEPGDGPEDLLTVIGQQNSGLNQRSEPGPYCRVCSAAAHPAVFEPLGGRLARRKHSRDQALQRRRKHRRL